MKTKNIVFIAYGQRRLWERVIAAVCYTIAFYCIYKFIVYYDSVIVRKNYRGLASYLEIAAILLVVALKFSLSVGYHFDTVKRRFKKSYDLGAIRMGRWRAIEDTEYISVFTRRGFHTEINLWYGDGNHVTIDACDTDKEALVEGAKIARKLGVGLWDATVPHQEKWVKLADE